ncbi:MAG: hypothetical protein ACRDD1_09500, partial [Planctomycetia bacterium]
ATLAVGVAGTPEAARLWRAMTTGATPDDGKPAADAALGSSDEWRKRTVAFEEIERRSAEPASYAASQELLQELDDWSRTASERFPVQYAEGGWKDRVEALRNRLLSTPPPRGLAAVEEYLDKLLTEKGNDRTAVFTELATYAGAAKGDRAYSAEAREEWRKIEDYSRRLLDGLVLRLDESWLQTDAWWTLTADPLQLEIWIAPKGTPQPFDGSTRHATPTAGDPGTPDLATLSTAAVAPSYNAEARQYVFRWVRGWSNDRRLSLDDTVWIRFDTPGWYSGNETASKTTPLHGTDRLGWFNRRQALSINGKPAECLIRLGVEPKLVVPETVARRLRFP